MWADVETNQDFLNYSEVAELTVDLIKDRRMRPLSIGVFGTWGTGKSTLLNLIEGQLAPGGAGTADYIIVRFDAWLYQGYDDARAALMEVIASELIADAKTKEKEDATLLNKAKKFLGRVNYFRAAGLLAEGGAALMGFPAFGAIAKGAGAFEHLLSSGELTGDEAKEVKEAGKDLAERSKGLIRPEEKRTPPQEIAAFRKELGDLLQGLGKTLVAFIDNLDRCLPKQTIQTLEALRLFLFMPSTAFVIAADEDMVKHSVATFFSDLDERHVTDYLDKLIQVPVRVPRVGVQEVRAYMFLLFATAGGVPGDKLEALRATLESNLRQAWKDEPISRGDALKVLEDTAKEDVAQAFDIAERMAPLLANATLVQGNPRIVKRMLNVVRMRSRLAQRRKIPLDEALIAKFALFERCTDETATAELYKAIQDSAGGKPDLFEALEKVLDDPDNFIGALPDAWKARHADFVRDWFSLEPKLADVDLRPALYLSRETQPLRIARGARSPAAEQALRLLLKATNTAAPSARKALTLTPAAEHAAMMDAIIDELRKAEDWKTKPQGFDGAAVLAEAHHEAGQALARFLRSTVPKHPPWLVVLIKDAAWFKTEAKR